MCESFPSGLSEALGLQSPAEEARLGFQRKIAYHGEQLDFKRCFCIDLTGTVCRCERHFQEEIFTVTDILKPFPEKGKRVLSQFHVCLLPDQKANLSVMAPEK